MTRIITRTTRALLSKQHSISSCHLTQCTRSVTQQTHSRYYTQMLVNSATKSLTNGIMAHDDYLLNGIPEAKYDLNQHIEPGLTLEHIFALEPHIDPYAAVAEDLSSISDNISHIIGSDHAVLNQIAKYFFNVNGKRVRPAIILLLSRALNRGLHDDENEHAFVDIQTLQSQSRDGLDIVSQPQHRISEIAELIHTASLLHDDVIDEADTRRGVASVNSAFGNKFAVLGGDFLLARASVALARLRHPVVIESMSTIIEHLVKGEILQLKAQQSNINSSSSTFDSRLSYYMTKTFYKTASLLANSCRSAAILGGHSQKLQDISYEYGKHVGLAFQIIDDILDFEGDSKIMGKPQAWDLSHGIVTSPVIFAIQARPELAARIERANRNKSNASEYQAEMQEITQIIRDSNGIEKARQLAFECAENACAALLQLRPSVPRAALVQIIHHVLYRKK